MPPAALNDGVTGKPSAASVNIHFVGMTERCAPHRIVVPQSGEGGGMTPPHGGMSVRGELDGTSDPRFGERRSVTWNEVTALSSLCKEVQELDATFRNRILPSIVLFGADDDASSLHMPGARKDVLDEEAQERRELAMLARIGKFLPALYRPLHVLLPHDSKVHGLLLLGTAARRSRVLMHASSGNSSCTPSPSSQNVTWTRPFSD